MEWVYLSIKIDICSAAPTQFIPGVVSYASMAYHSNDLTMRVRVHVSILPFR